MGKSFITGLRTGSIRLRSAVHWNSKGKQICLRKSKIKLRYLSILSERPNLIHNSRNNRRTLGVQGALLRWELLSSRWSFKTGKSQKQWLIHQYCKLSNRWSVRSWNKNNKCGIATLWGRKRTLEGRTNWNTWEVIFSAFISPISRTLVIQWGRSWAKSWLFCHRKKWSLRPTDFSFLSLYTYISSLDFWIPFLLIYNYFRNDLGR